MPAMESSTSIRGNDFPIARAFEALFVSLSLTQTLTPEVLRERIGDLSADQRLILGRQCSPPSEDPSRTLLMLAAGLGRLDLLEFLLPISDPRQSVEAGNGLLITALSEAARNGHLQAVELLLPVSDAKMGSSGALMLAAHAGHRDIVQLLWPLSDLQARDPWGATALMNAACAPDDACVRLLWPHCDPLVTNTETPSQASDGRELFYTALSYAALGDASRPDHPLLFLIEGYKNLGPSGQHVIDDALALLLEDTGTEDGQIGIANLLSAVTTPAGLQFAIQHGLDEEGASGLREPVMAHLERLAMQSDLMSAPTDGSVNRVAKPKRRI